MLDRFRNKESWSLRYSAAFGLLLGAFVGFLITAGIFLISREGVTKIATVTVAGNVGISTNRILREVDSELASHDCFVYTTCNFGLWYPQAGIPSHLKTLFPRIDDVQLQFIRMQPWPRGNGILRVVVHERTPAARWCLDTSFLNCYYIDTTGVVFERAPYFEPVSELPIIVPDRSRITLPDIEGKRLPFPLWQDPVQITSVFDLLRRVREYADVVQITYTERDMLVYLSSLYEYYTDSHPYLKINRENLGDDSYRELVSRSLRGFETYEPFFGRFKVYPDSLDYLDIRFDNRVYMKFKDAAPIAGAKDPNAVVKTDLAQ